MKKGSSEQKQACAEGRSGSVGVSRPKAATPVLPPVEGLVHSDSARGPCLALLPGGGSVELGLHVLLTREFRRLDKSQGHSNVAHATAANGGGHTNDCVSSTENHGLRPGGSIPSGSASTPVSNTSEGTTSVSGSCSSTPSSQRQQRHQCPAWSISMALRVLAEACLAVPLQIVENGGRSANVSEVGKSGPEVSVEGTFYGRQLPAVRGVYSTRPPCKSGCSPALTAFHQALTMVSIQPATCCTAGVCQKIF